jgi:hypothetical protein
VPPTPPPSDDFGDWSRPPGRSPARRDWRPAGPGRGPDEHTPPPWDRPEGSRHQGTPHEANPHEADRQEGGRQEGGRQEGGRQEGGRQERHRRRDEPERDTGSQAVAVDGAALAPPVPVRRLLSLVIAGFAALLTVGLVVGAQTTHASHAVVIFFVQVLFVGVWTIASRPPAPRVVVAVGIAVALGSDVAAIWTRPASLAPLAYVTAAGFIVGVIGQLTRPAGRVRVTESLGSTLVVTLGVVAFAALVVLGRIPRGTQALDACLAAVGVAIVIARFVDAIVAAPRIAPQVPRGGAGVVLGAMAGTAAAGAIGYVVDGIPHLQTAIAGLVTAVVAVMVDLSVGYAEASRHIDGDAPTLWLARHLQGPLGAFAFSAPVAYAASELLLLRG